MLHSNLPFFLSQTLQTIYQPRKNVLSQKLGINYRKPISEHLKVKKPFVTSKIPQTRYDQHQQQQKNISQEQPTDPSPYLQSPGRRKNRTRNKQPSIKKPRNSPFRNDTFGVALTGSADRLSYGGRGDAVSRAYHSRRGSAAESADRVDKLPIRTPPGMLLRGCSRVTDAAGCARAIGVGGFYPLLDLDKHVSVAGWTY